MIAKPNREPDYISSVGVYFWFNELIFLSPFGQLVKMFFDEGSNLLRTERFTAKCYDCERCLSGRDCDRAYLAEHVQEAYRKWDASVFENAVLGDNNDT